MAVSQVQEAQRPSRFVYLGHLATFGTAVLWGSTYVGAKFALETMGPLSAAFYRFLVTAAITWPLLALTKGIRRVPKSAWWNLLGVALLNTTFYFSVQYVGLRFTSASNTGLIVNTRPIILALLAVVFFKERFTIKQWGALFLAFAGVVLILRNPGADANLPDHLIGDLLILLNAVIGAFGIIFTKRALKVFPRFTLLVYQVTIGALGLLPMAYFESGSGLFDLGEVAWGPILYLAVFCTALGQVLMYTGLTYLPVSITGAYLFIIPIFNAILSYLVLGEPLTWMLLFGGALILGGTYLVNQAQVSPEEVLQKGTS